jgi:trigger factor
MLEEQVAERIARMSDEAAQFGGTLDELLQLEGTSREDYEVRLREQTETMLRAQLVLDALARKLELTLASSDLDREFARLAMEHRTDARTIARLVQEQGTLPVLVGDVLRRKAIDTLLETAEVTGGPDEGTLISLGLAEDPATASDVEADDQSGVEADVEPDDEA